MALEEHDKWYKNYPPSTHLMPRLEYNRLVWKEALKWAVDNLEQYIDEWNLDDLWDIREEIGDKS